MLSTSATAFAMETETNADNWLVSANQHQIIHNAKIAAETGQNVTLTTKILSDLSDNHFELVEVGDTGYMIFDPQSGKYLEEALDSPSPYLGLSENLYYFGPLNYYQLSGDKFVHTVIHNALARTHHISAGILKHRHEIRHYKTLVHRKIQKY